MKQFVTRLKIYWRMLLFGNPSFFRMINTLSSSILSISVLKQFRHAWQETPIHIQIY